MIAASPDSGGCGEFFAPFTGLTIRLRFAGRSVMRGAKSCELNKSVVVRETTFLPVTVFPVCSDNWFGVCARTWAGKLSKWKRPVSATITKMRVKPITSLPRYLKSVGQKYLRIIFNELQTVNNCFAEAVHKASHLESTRTCDKLCAFPKICFFLTFSGGQID